MDGLIHGTIGILRRMILKPEAGVDAGNPDDPSHWVYLDLDILTCYPIVYLSS